MREARNGLRGAWAALRGRQGPRAPMDYPAVAAITFLVAAAGLMIFSLPFRGYIRPGWEPAWCGMAAGCLVTAAVIAVMRRVTTPVAAVVSFGADVLIAVASLTLANPSFGQLVTLMLTVPILFMSIFMTWPWILAQSAIAFSYSYLVYVRAGSGTIALLQAVMQLIATTSPAVIVMILRRRLDEALSRAESQATTDPLTRLANRRGLEARYPATVATARRSGQVVVAVVADVDHFKTVNDEHGHGVGDLVLQTVAAVVTGSVRQDDVVARLGGEELAVVGVADPRALGEIAAMCERIRREIAMAPLVCPVTASLGAAWASPDDPEVDLWILISRADRLMYEAKRAGRNRVRLADIPQGAR
jgi:diguanylate cyclase (GGDEF)-like protein